MKTTIVRLVISQTKYELVARGAVLKYWATLILESKLFELNGTPIADTESSFSFIAHVEPHRLEQQVIADAKRTIGAMARSKGITEAQWTDSNEVWVF